MQRLTTPDVVRAINKALKENRLGAAVGKTMCYYDYGDGCGCAVGVALNEDTLSQIKGRYNGCNIYGLSEFVDISGYGAEIDSLQSRHDEWATANNYDKTRSDIARHEFFAYLNKMRDKYELTDDDV